MANNIISQTVEAIVTDLDGNIKRVNSSFTKITSYEETEVIGRNTRILDSINIIKNFTVTCGNVIKKMVFGKGKYIIRGKVVIFTCNGYLLPL
ncbi:PAS domain S-box protein [Niallia sp. Krafla_26]|uniref:PAS domain S-box protein n=1 Tax=Niallia sp. Krafla_26 TaxID=3064703 RepID=UPI003D176957